MRQRMRLTTRSWRDRMTWGYRAEYNALRRGARLFATHVRLPLARLWLAGLVLLVAGACRTTAAPQTVVYGQWRVFGSRCPTTCELSAAEATQWTGRIARYSETRAQFADHSCPRPRYVVDYWPASGIYGGVRLTDLGITTGSVKVVDVQCASPPPAGSDAWARGPGAFLIVADPAHLFMVWQGTYFDLRRE